MDPSESSDQTWRPTTLDYYVDIVGACNLRCPSCAQGNSPETSRPKGTMSLELFDQVLEKIASETTGKGTPKLYLFNWGEPLLHPQAPEIVARIKAKGWLCLLSSNLERPRDLRGVVAARPDWLRISLSGYRQETYGRTHRGGNVNRVKANMYLLRALLDEMRIAMTVQVNYHVYRHNAVDDFERMRALSAELGYQFEPIWAIPAPLEKVVRWLHGDVAEADRDLKELLVVEPEEARAISLARAHLAPSGCALQDATLVNSDGSVDLCCATWEVGTVVPSFVASTPEERQRKKLEHPFCATCMPEGLHLTSVQVGKDAWDARARTRLQSDLLARRRGEHGIWEPIRVPVRRLATVPDAPTATDVP
jgi:pyruvate-formate lyase-activating enzyme